MDKSADLAPTSSRNRDHTLLLRSLVSDFTPIVEVSATDLENGIPRIIAKLPADLWSRYAHDIVEKIDFRRGIEKRIRDLFKEQKYAKLVSPLIIQWREDGPDFKLGEHKGCKPEEVCSVVLNYPEKKYVSVNILELSQGVVLFHALKIYLEDLYTEFGRIESENSAIIGPTAGYEKIELRLGPE
jgi:hypothetical protein